MDNKIAEAVVLYHEILEFTAKANLDVKVINNGYGSNSPIVFYAAKKEIASFDSLLEGKAFLLGKLCLK